MGKKLPMPNDGSCYKSGNPFGNALPPQCPKRRREQPRLPTRRWSFLSLSMNEVTLIRNLNPFVTNALRFSINEVTLIRNLNAFVTNVLRFSMDEVTLRRSLNPFVTNVLRFSMNEVTLITKADFASA